MSSALGIAAVTAVLKDLLNNGLIDHNVSGAVGGNVTVTALPPDRVIPPGGTESDQLNLFLHQVTPNAGWRNGNLPSHDSRGNRIDNPPLALDLHYLLTAYGADDLHGEILLGYAMQLLHERPVLTRDAIRAALTPSPLNGAILPPAFQALSAADLADQVELIKITPASLNGEEMSRLWSALQAHYRTTTAYHVSVVLIDPNRPAKSALPVLTRGPVDPFLQQERGIAVQGDLSSPFPAITKLSLPDDQSVAEPGGAVTIEGSRLDGEAVVVRLTSPRTSVPLEVLPASMSATKVSFVVPDSPAVAPAGSYMVAVLLQRPGESDRRTTNELPLPVAAQIVTPSPISVASDATGAATIQIACKPLIRPEQRVALILGDREIPSQPHPNPASTLTFIAKAAKPGSYLMRLRVDGVDSVIVNRAVRPPVFLDRKVNIT